MISVTSPGLLKALKSRLLNLNVDEEALLSHSHRGSRKTGCTSPSSLCTECTLSSAGKGTQVFLLNLFLPLNPFLIPGFCPVEKKMDPDLLEI